MASPTTKQPYAKPAVRTIRIVPGEMAVAGCKTRLSTTGPAVGCVRTSCMSAGS